MVQLLHHTWTSFTLKIFVYIKLGCKIFIYKTFHFAHNNIHYVHFYITSIGISYPIHSCAKVNKLQGYVCMYNIVWVSPLDSILFSGNL